MNTLNLSPVSVTVLSTRDWLECYLQVNTIFSSRVCSLRMIQCLNFHSPEILTDLTARVEIIAKQ